MGQMIVLQFLGNPIYYLPLEFFFYIWPIYDFFPNLTIRDPLKPLY